MLFEEGGAFSDTKHYLYGLACLGEHVDADEPAEEEWRTYQRDAKNMVRQTSDADRQVTMAWTYSPTGGVVLGEGGPVTNLDCGTGGIYDWSTGLIFKNGRYFDPSTGIWITMGAIVTWQIWPKENRRQRRSRRKTKANLNLLFLFLILILLALALTGCKPDPCPITPTPGTPTIPPTLPPTGTPTPTDTPPYIPPTAPPQVPPVDSPTPEPTEPPTPEPPPTSTPLPMTGFQLSDPFGTEGNGFYWTCFFGDTGCGKPETGHDGIDLVSKRYIDRSCSDSSPRCGNREETFGPAQPADVTYRTVYSPVTGVIARIDPSFNDQLTINQVRNPSRPQDPPINGLEIELFHLKPRFGLSEGLEVRAGGTELGHFDDVYPHLHLGLIENGGHKDPYPWLSSSNLGPYFTERGGSYVSLPKRP